MKDQILELIGRVLIIVFYLLFLAVAGAMPIVIAYCIIKMLTKLTL